MNNTTMRKPLAALLALASCLTALLSCSDDDTYADQKKREKNAINHFIGRDVTIRDAQGDSVCRVGRINAISEQQFLLQDSVTDLGRNEYVLFANSGVYMQIVRKGTGPKVEPGQTKRVLARFVEYNILGDSLQLRSDVAYWAPSPDIMSVTNNSGTFTGMFDTSVNGGGAMYLTYKSTSVPSGWLVPFTYIHVGRQTGEEGIAKVRLIVPHSEGHTSASGNVYPCFYEITYQQMRD